MPLYCRRSPVLVSYWQSGDLVFENYLAGTRTAAAPVTSAILHFFERWRPVTDLAAVFPQFTAASLSRTLAQLASAQLLEISRSPRPSAKNTAASWESWGPSAAFFHFSTKDTNTPVEPDDSLKNLRRRARAVRPPPPFKALSGVPKVLLPEPVVSGDFSRALLARRTWRKFSAAPVALADLSTLLWLTFGVQWWLEYPGVGRVPKKTSPSGGSRHPIEGYVYALRVAGLPRGVYHYNSAAHRLERIRRGAAAPEISRLLNRQWWFGKAAFVVFLTAVFARTEWKYPAPRAYRAVLAEAGHVCQTFCLTAASRGLAPFCTMAMRDSAVERALKIDGVSESVLYATGCGLPPKGSGWSPWPGRPLGRRVPNSPARR
ncbi:MAG TPA: SagB/ThcOx family dehydrogenase [Candidatus Acidoferrales bacterium]|nr:SagB/ThcOx family dehydrogenase [Candidatus Acidoferrales bacterium]